MSWKLTGWTILHAVCFIISGFIIMQIHKLTPIFIQNYFNIVYLVGLAPLLISVGFHIRYISDNASEDKHNTIHPSLNKYKTVSTNIEV